MNSKAVSHLLDIVEVAASHMGAALADVFAKILDKFSVSHKVREKPVVINVKTQGSFLIVTVYHLR